MDSFFQVSSFILQSTNGSMSIMLDSGKCFVGLDDGVRDGGVQEQVHLSNELGHCVTRSFYYIYAAVDAASATKTGRTSGPALIPVDALDDAVADGCTEVWELAERFQVTEEFVRKAVCWYVHGNMAAELYF